jgi:hypothetical protein
MQKRCWMHVGSGSCRHRPSIASRFERDCPRDGGAGCGGAIYKRRCGGDRVEEGDCQMSFRSEVVVERMEKKEGREKLEGAVETENESLLRIRNTNYVCTPIL